MQSRLQIICATRVSKPPPRLTNDSNFNQNSVTYNTFDCLICFEAHRKLNKFNRAEQNCRACGIGICTTCLGKHMDASVERAHQYNKRPQLTCPHCRLNPWFLPNFAVQYEDGHDLEVDHQGKPKLGYIGLYAGPNPTGEGECVFLHPIHDDTKIIGHVTIYHCPDFYEAPPSSWHIKDIEAIERFAFDKGVLTSKLTKSPGCICKYFGAGDEEHTLCQLEDADISYVKLKPKVFAVECFEDALGINLF